MLRLFKVAIHTENLANNITRENSRVNRIPEIEFIKKRQRKLAFAIKFNSLSVQDHKRVRYV